MGVAYVFQVLSVCVLSLAAVEPARLEVQLLTVGEHHGEQVPADAAGLWWGLFPKGDGYELLKVNVSVEIVFDPILDDEGEKSGKLVSIEEKRKPLFLVRGIGNLTEGPVKTFWHEQNLKFLYPGESLYIREQEKKGVRITAWGKTGRDRGQSG